MIKLMFDAGHYNGYNPAPLFPSYKEGDKMYILTNYIREHILSNYEGVEIALTRSNNKVDVPVYDRGAKSKGYNAFYSFHSNSVDDTSVTRVVIIRAYGNTTLDKYCMELADTIKNCMGITQKSQVYEKGTLTNNEYYGVLRGAKVVGTKERFIIEHGFHSNKEVAKWLYNNENLKKLAIVEGDCIAKHHGLKKKSPTMIKVIKDVNYRSKPIFNDDKYVVGKATKGNVFTVVDRVKSDTSTDMYKLKSGNYITTSSKYIDPYKKD